MKSSLKWITILAAVLAGLLVTGTALADYPVNPYRLEAIPPRSLNGSPASRALVSGVTISEITAPTLTQAGAWTVTVNSDVVSKEGPVTRIRVYFMSPDPDGGYSATWFVTLEGDSLTAAASAANTYTIATANRFVCPGSYEMWAYVYFNNSNSAANAGSFSIEIAPDGQTPTRAERVTQIVAQCRVEGDDWQTALNLHDWLTTHVYYDSGYTFYGAEDALFRGYGVCDSYSKAYEFLLDEAGFESVRVTSNNHAWNAVKINGAWYHIDATWDDPSGSDQAVSGYERHDYFCLNDELIFGLLDNNASHQNGVRNAPSCTALAAWYPVHTGEWVDYDAWIDDTDWSSGHYGDDMAAQVRNGNVSFELPANQYYQRPDGAYYTSMEIAARRRYAYAAGLTEYGLTVDNDIFRVNVTFNTSDYVFSVRLLGWMYPGEGELLLPNDVREVGGYAFASAAAATVVIPAGCETIGAYAFAGSSVRTVRFLGADTVIDSDAFAECAWIIVIAPSGGAVADYCAQNGFMRIDP